MLELMLIAGGVMLLTLGRKLWFVGQVRLTLWEAVEQAYSPGLPSDLAPGETRPVSLSGQLVPAAPGSLSGEGELLLRDGTRVGVVSRDLSRPEPGAARLLLFGTLRQVAQAVGYRESGMRWQLDAQVIVEQTLIPRALRLARAVQAGAAVISGTGGMLIGFALCSALATAFSCGRI